MTAQLATRVDQELVLFPWSAFCKNNRGTKSNNNDLPSSLTMTMTTTTTMMMTTATSSVAMAQHHDIPPESIALLEVASAAEAKENYDPSQAIGTGKETGVNDNKHPKWGTRALVQWFDLVEDNWKRTWKMTLSAMKVFKLHN